MRVVYFDCFSGISGDMSLAALVDAGADRAYVESELQKIRIEPFELQWKRVNKKGISALKMDVALDPHKQPTHHRHYADIVKMIQEAGFNERTTALSLAIFEKIGVAEGKIHGIPLEKVHFHEVGAIDSIVDVIGVALALDSLEADHIYCSPVPLGSGTVRCDHGLYPVPAPATLEMMRGLPIAPTDYAMEMTTPTGAGIVAAVVNGFSKGLPPMVVESIGYGAGTRDLPNQPNVLRVVVGKIDAYAAKWTAPNLHLHAEHGHEEHHHHHHGDDGLDHGHGHGHHHHGHEHDHHHDHHDHHHDHDDHSHHDDRDHHDGHDDHDDHDHHVHGSHHHGHEHRHDDEHRTGASPKH
ncbi:LarC family nickel insertion protein [Paenibacillus hodogayensis]|uniref:LarC family nickel insertion protein n=1 Tax=Paenibacillus hodogayensis TaxID=279208 RepID=A0ABV5VU62_9BACL